MEYISDRKEEANLFAICSYFKVIHSPITCSFRNGSSCFPLAAQSELMSLFPFPPQHSHQSLQHSLLLQASKCQSTLTDLHWRAPGLTCKLLAADCRKTERGFSRGLQILLSGFQAHSGCWHLLPL